MKLKEVPKTKPMAIMVFNDPPGFDYTLNAVFMQLHQQLGVLCQTSVQFLSDHPTVKFIKPKGHCILLQSVIIDKALLVGMSQLQDCSKIGQLLDTCAQQ